jgi:hypothetical protein
LAECVNLREAPSMDSATVGQVEPTGTVVTILAAVQAGDGTWYQVQFGEITAYIRGDLLELDLPAAPVPLEPEAPLPPVPAILEQPAREAWQYGAAEQVLRFGVADAAAYRWQRGAVGEDGAIVWEDIPGAEANECALAVDMDALKFPYRSVATMPDGAEVVSDEVTLIRADLVAWLNGNEISGEMLERAMRSNSLESLVIEGDRLIHVRTGEVVAYFDEATGELVDARSGLTIAELDAESRMIYPVQPTLPIASAEAGS